MAEYTFVEGRVRARVRQPPMVLGAVAFSKGLSCPSEADLYGIFWFVTGVPPIGKRGANHRGKANMHTSCKAIFFSTESVLA